MRWKVVERWFDANRALRRINGLWEGNGGQDGAMAKQRLHGWAIPLSTLDACWTYDLDREKMRAGGLVQLNKQLADSQAE